MSLGGLRSGGGGDGGERDEGVKTMNTVFSHIIQKLLPKETENVATEALAFIVESSEAARNGLMSMLQAIEPALPDLRFSAQKSEGSARPDMQGLDDNTPRVFIENKFWAGLTENQPVEYLRLLAKCEKPAVLLVVAPEKRLETIWRELGHRLDDDIVGAPEETPPAGIHGILRTELGPTLALASWTSLFLQIEAKVKDEPRSLNDLGQLRALCGAADRNAFIPLSSTDLTDQRIPALVLQLISVVDRAVSVCVTERVLSLKGLTKQSNWERMGRYIDFPGRVGVWIGVDFDLWRRYGGTPLWLEFMPTKWGRAPEVRRVLEPWADGEGLPSGMKDKDFPFVVGIDLVTGEERDLVVRSVADRIRSIAKILLSDLPERQV